MGNAFLSRFADLVVYCAFITGNGPGHNCTIPRKHAPVY
jgi:hypothetical protein